jgi:hypothetical protein
MSAEPLTLLQIADGLDAAIRMARALEFACKGAGLDSDTTNALTEMAARHHDDLKRLVEALDPYLDAKRLTELEAYRQAQS